MVWFNWVSQYMFEYVSVIDALCLMFKEVKPRVRDMTLEISDMFVLYSISLKSFKLSFETE